MLKKILCMLSITTILFGLIGCSINNKKKEDGKLTIIATLFPQYDFAKQIVGDKGNVELLLPAGVDAHSFDPTPSDIININKADMFVYTGKYMEVWAADFIEGLENKELEVVDA